MRSSNSTFKILVLVFGSLLALGLIQSELEKRITALRNRTAITAQSDNQATPPPTVEPTASKDSRQTNKQSLPQKESFTGDKALLGLYIKPCLIAMLDDPGSLQDFRVVSAKPEKGEPRVLEVVVFYRARNGFGALIAKWQK